MSILLLGVGLYIRLGILETPTFTRLTAENKLPRRRCWEVIKRQPKEIILSGLARIGSSPHSIFSPLLYSPTAPPISACARYPDPGDAGRGGVFVFHGAVLRWLSDRWAASATYLTGLAVLCGLYVLCIFGLLDTRVPMVVFLVIATSLIPTT